ncbi:MAG TPA: outer membrane beta-barrel protein, partial [Gillisia sp.]|nr:outer membrane beta-barrel protein [Gillisia sp.]
MTTLSIGFRKTFWNNRAELSLNFEDILDKTNTRLTSEYLNQDNSFFAREELRYVRIGFKYNFGNFRLQDNKRSIDAAERDRI